jgi:hypothetical protein
MGSDPADHAGRDRDSRERNCSQTERKHCAPHVIEGPWNGQNIATRRDNRRTSVIRPRQPRRRPSRAHDVSAPQPCRPRSFVGGGCAALARGNELPFAPLHIEHPESTRTGVAKDRIRPSDSACRFTALDPGDTILEPPFVARSGPGSGTDLMRLLRKPMKTRSIGPPGGIQGLAACNRGVRRLRRSAS